MMPCKKNLEYEALSIYTSSHSSFYTNLAWHCTKKPPPLSLSICPSCLLAYLPSFLPAWLSACPPAEPAFLSAPPPAPGRLSFLPLSFLLASLLLYRLAYSLAYSLAHSHGHSVASGLSEHSTHALLVHSTKDVQHCKAKTQKIKTNHNPMYV